jgi:hypothetical protein
MVFRKRKNDIGNRIQGELTKERGGTTVKFKDSENGRKEKKERQRKGKTEKMDLSQGKNNTGNRRQGELTKELAGTTVEFKDRENGRKKEKERQRKQKTETMEFRKENERQR